MIKLEQYCTDQCELLSTVDLLAVIGGGAPPVPPFQPLETDSTSGGGSERGASGLESLAPPMYGD